jgi:uncharacterized membrane protein
MSARTPSIDFEQSLDSVDQTTSTVGRAAYAIAGLSGVLYGAWRRDRLGWPLLLGGGYFLYRAAVQKIPQENSIRLAQTVNRSADEIYSFWRDFQNWPLFMDGMDRVQSADSMTVAWTGENGSIDGESAILEEQPGQLLRWLSRVENDEYEAAIELRPAPSNRGTEIYFHLLDRKPQTVVSQILRRATGDSMEQWGRESLRALKQLMEAGEVPTTDGQPHGSRGAKGKIERAVFREGVEEKKRQPRATRIPNQKLAAS